MMAQLCQAVLGWCVGPSLAVAELSVLLPSTDGPFYGDGTDPAVFQTLGTCILRTLFPGVREQRSVLRGWNGPPFPDSGKTGLFQGRGTFWSSRSPGRRVRSEGVERTQVRSKGVERTAGRGQ